MIVLQVFKHKGSLRIPVYNHTGKIRLREFSDWTLGLLSLVHCFSRYIECSLVCLCNLEELWLGTTWGIHQYKQCLNHKQPQTSTLAAGSTWLSFLAIEPFPLCVFPALFSGASAAYTPHSLGHWMVRMSELRWPLFLLCYGLNKSHGFASMLLYVMMFL